MKFSILKILADANGFVSGEEIGRELKISRAAVGKNVAKLKEMGYVIEAVNNRGYRLESRLGVLNEFELADGLETEFLARKCVYFDEIDSTNDEAKRRAEKGECNGFLVFSDSQSAGKGRFGRSWKSEKGACVYFSFILRPDIMPVEAPILTLVAGLGVLRGIKKMTALDVKIKWPNDIVINGKKVVGILTEMSAEIERVKYIVVGIGININNKSFDDEIAYKATSIAIQTGKSFNRIRILQAVLKEIEICCNSFNDGGFSALRDEYIQNCVNMHTDVRLTCKGSQIEGRTVDINEKGEIVIEKKDGEIINVFGGEVSLRRADGRYV